MDSNLLATAYIICLGVLLHSTSLTVCKAVPQFALAPQDQITTGIPAHTTYPVADSEDSKVINTSEPIDVKEYRSINIGDQMLRESSESVRQETTKTKRSTNLNLTKPPTQNSRLSSIFWLAFSFTRNFGLTLVTRPTAKTTEKTPSEKYLEKNFEKIMSTTPASSFSDYNIYEETATPAPIRNQESKNQDSIPEKLYVPRKTSTTPGPLERLQSEIKDSNVTMETAIPTTLNQSEQGFGHPGTKRTINCTLEKDCTLDTVSGYGDYITLDEFSREISKTGRSRQVPSHEILYDFLAELTRLQRDVNTTIDVLCHNSVVGDFPPEMPSCRIYARTKGQRELPCNRSLIAPETKEGESVKDVLINSLEAINDHKELLQTVSRLHDLLYPIKPQCQNVTEFSTEHIQCKHEVAILRLKRVQNIGSEMLSELDVKDLSGRSQISCTIDMSIKKKFSFGLLWRVQNELAKILDNLENSL